MNKKNGFTLVELLVVMAILALLTTVGFGQYRTSQKKASDAQRKADLGNIARALEMYYNDNGSYPTSTDCTSAEQGLIVVEKDCSIPIPTSTNIDWGSSFQITINNTTIIYMKSLPVDPASNQHYCYESADGGAFRIFAVLENENDLDFGDYTCNSEDYSYGTSSTNINL